MTPNGRACHKWATTWASTLALETHDTNAQQLTPTLETHNTNAQQLTPVLETYDTNARQLTPVLETYDTNARLQPPKTNPFTPTKATPVSQASQHHCHLERRATQAIFL